MRRVVTTATALMLAVLVAGCGGSDDEPDSAEAPAMADSAAADSDGSDTGGDDAGSGEPSESAEISPVLDEQIDAEPRHVIYTVDLLVETDNVARAAQRAATLAQSAGGFVAAESTSGEDSATLTLRVPSADHTSIVAQLEELGEVVERSRNASDVTAEVVDVEARVASQRRSIDRIRELLGRADDLGDIVRIESELADREAILDSLLQRQSQLGSLTSLATVTVTFSTVDDAKADEDALGFLTGLRGGWEAFVSFVAVASTIVGALLPFLVTIAVLGVPAWLLLRRRQRGPAPDASTP